MGPHSRASSKVDRSVSRFVLLEVLVFCIVALLAVPAARSSSPIGPQDPILLLPVVTAPPGTEQAYLITGRQWELDESAWGESASGFPGGAPGTAREAVDGAAFDATSLPLDQATELAALYVRYRVLEPAPDGALRLEAYAQAVDGLTGLPLALPAWTGVMRITSSEVVFEDGDLPDWAIVMTETPEWLAGWLSRSEDMPQGPVAPGAVWTSRQDELPFDLPSGFRVTSASIDIEGTFPGWVQRAPAPETPAATAAAAAAVVERFSGALHGEFIPFDLLFDCDSDDCLGPEWVFGFDLAVSGEVELWLVPDDFPLGGRSAQHVKVAWDADIPTAYGYTEIEINRFDGAIPAPATLPLTAGESRRGELAQWSLLRAEEGYVVDAPADLYTFEGTEGHKVLLTMKPANADESLEPALFLFDASGNTIAEGEFYSDGDIEGAALFADLPYSGLYYVQATTLPGGAGLYELTFETGADLEYEPPFELGDWSDFWSILDSFDWDSIDWNSADPDSADPDSTEDMTGWDWEDDAVVDYAQCEALQAGNSSCVCRRVRRPGHENAPAGNGRRRLRRVARHLLVLR